MAFVIIWIVCGLLAAGISFGTLQEEYSELAKGDYRKDLAFSYSVGLLGGPATLIAALFLAASYAFRIRKAVIHIYFW